MFLSDYEGFYDGGMVRISCVGCLLEWYERLGEI